MYRNTYSNLLLDRVFEILSGLIWSGCLKSLQISQISKVASSLYGYQSKLYYDYTLLATQVPYDRHRPIGGTGVTQQSNSCYSSLEKRRSRIPGTTVFVKKII